MKYGTLYNEADIFTNQDNTPGASGMPGSTAMQSNGMNTAAPAVPLHLVLHATTQYDANHNKVKVKDPHALGLGSEKPLIHGNSWVLGDAYCLDMDDPYFKANHPNPKKADVVNHSIYGFFAAFVCLILASVNAFYEILIWIFENINMTDEAFFAVDNVIYFGQFFLPFIVVIFVIIKQRMLHKSNLMFCKQMLQHYAIEDEKQHFDRTHEFLDICPQCGAARLPDTRECPYCGTSLLRMIENETNM